MDSANAALDALREIFGLDRLSFDDDGQAAILIEEAVPVQITRVADDALEFSVALPDLAGKLTPARLIAMLQANYLGAYTGTGRVALDPRDGQPVYGQRVDVPGLGPAELEAAFVAFVSYATHWLGNGTERLLDLEVAPPPSGALDHPGEELLLRL